ncbi:uncharacterized protein EV154DRAFT_570333 [Mucor mucedo]|uniref:uncharacterized protein n=1 Tax=Mucor mucedo TaxID=29922 RepID=UPI00221EF080|nr:uncharacterized protein EV154DRAFT_570333 [Mucor mucedo]KAI7873160.1 hypothetical protein EV154DRAFT_570333 [Mucor mucedo]
MLLMEGITVVDLTESQDERKVREEEQEEVKMFYEVDLERVFGSQSTAPELITRMRKNTTDAYLTVLADRASLLDALTRRIGTGQVMGKGPGDEYAALMGAQNIVDYTTSFTNMGFTLTENSKNPRILKNIFCMMMNIMYDEIIRRLVYGGSDARRLMIANGIPEDNFMRNLNRVEQVEPIHEEIQDMKESKEFSFPTVGSGFYFVVSVLYRMNS